MPTTRSAGKKQASLDEYKEGTSMRPKPTTTAKANTAAKRKAPPTEKTISQPTKKTKTKQNDTKQSHFASDASTDLEKPITINRSPVLQLWGATVAQFLHPEEEWGTCLGIGGSIARLCAISKGRAIGQIEPKDESPEASKKRKEKKSKTKQESRELEVMGFPMSIKNNEVMVDGKPKPLKESAMYSKYGGEANLKKTKDTMMEALQSWKKNKPELDKKAFHMYEKFRPNVATDSSGWGRKGELNLQTVKNTIVK